MDSDISAGSTAWDIILKWKLHRNSQWASGEIGAWTFGTGGIDKVYTLQSLQPPSRQPEGIQGNLNKLMFHQSFIGFCKFVQNTLFRTNNIQLEDLQRRLMDSGLIARGARERQTGDFESV